MRLHYSVLCIILLSLVFVGGCRRRVKSHLPPAERLAPSAFEVRISKTSGEVRITNKSGRAFQQYNLTLSSTFPNNGFAPENIIAPGKSWNNNETKTAYAKMRDTDQGLIATTLKIYFGGSDEEHPFKEGEQYFDEGNTASKIQPFYYNYEATFPLR